MPYGRVTFTINAEFSDEDTFRDALDILDRVLPYIADNVMIRSEWSDGEH